MTTPHAVTDADLAQQILAAPEPVFVDCRAQFHGPSRMMATSIDHLAEQYRGKVRFVRLDVDVHPQLAWDLGVRTVPTFLVFAKGEIADQTVGAVSMDLLQEMIDRLLRASSRR